MQRLRPLLQLFSSDLPPLAVAHLTPLTHEVQARPPLFSTVDQITQGREEVSQTRADSKILLSSQLIMWVRTIKIKNSPSGSKRYHLKAVFVSGQWTKCEIIYNLPICQLTRRRSQRDSYLSFCSVLDRLELEECGLWNRKHKVHNRSLSSFTLWNHMKSINHQSLRV